MRVLRVPHKPRPLVRCSCGVVGFVEESELESALSLTKYSGALKIGGAGDHHDVAHLLREDAYGFFGGVYATRA